MGLVIISASKCCDESVIKGEVVSKEPQPSSLQSTDRVLVAERWEEAGSRADLSGVSTATPLCLPQPGGPAREQLAVPGPCLRAAGCAD